jgi:hypothetical protein
VLRRRWVLLAAVALVAAAATTAHAATLTMTSKTLFAMTSPANIPQVHVVYDPFTSAGVVTLDGRASSTGQTWDVVNRTLQVTGTQLQCSDCNGGNLGFAVIDAGFPQVTATVEVQKNGTGTSGAAGLVLNANATGSQSIDVLWDNGVVKLYRYSGGSLTQLAQASAAAISTTVGTPLVVTYSAGTYSVSFNGVALFNYTLTVADQTTFGANTYFGVAFNADNDRTRLDNFGVQQ